MQGVLENEPRTEPREDHREGPIARTIEQHTAKWPSDVFFWAALGSMGASATLFFTGQKQLSLFIGQWAAPFLILGHYNKTVKLHGSDGHHHHPHE